MPFRQLPHSSTPSLLHQIFIELLLRAVPPSGSFQSDGGENVHASAHCVVLISVRLLVLTLSISGKLRLQLGPIHSFIRLFLPQTLSESLLCASPWDTSMSQSRGPCPLAPAAPSYSYLLVSALLGMPFPLSRCPSLCPFAEIQSNPRGSSGVLPP